MEQKHNCNAQPDEKHGLSDCFTGTPAGIARALKLHNVSLCTSIHNLLVRLASSQGSGPLTDAKYKGVYRDMLYTSPFSRQGIRLLLPGSLEDVGLTQLPSVHAYTNLQKGMARWAGKQTTTVALTSLVWTHGSCFANACYHHTFCEPKNKPLVTAEGFLFFFELAHSYPELTSLCRGWRLARVLETRQLTAAKLRTLIDTVGLQHIDTLCELGVLDLLSDAAVDRLTAEPRVLTHLSFDSTERILRRWLTCHDAQLSLDTLIRTDPLLISPP